MLPNRMELSLLASQQLRKLKISSGLAPNIASRIGFFKSIESGFSYSPELSSKKELSKEEKKQIITLDKVTWLGQTQHVTELLLKMRYPNLSSRELQIAWASHVEHGISSLRNQKSITEILLNL